MIRRAKIIATLGPSSQESDCLQRLVEAGLNVARLNFSHGSHEGHAALIARLKELRDQSGRPIGILQDLQGPKLRTGMLAGGDPVFLVTGEQLTLTTESVEGTPSKISVDYEPLPNEVSPGDRILMDDGRLELRVLKVEGQEVLTEVVNGGLLGNRKGINLPGVKISAPCMTEKDFEDLRFGIEHGVDAVALSFVRKGHDMQELRNAIRDMQPGGQQPFLIAKLERPEAVDHLEDILEASDGVMVARGDLGVEVSPERVPSLQKLIIHRSRAKQKFVITATQMLETMIENPRPTRAEASDVANAVFDGSDALMLSGETSIGKYPIAAVETMSRIILDAEAHAVEWGVSISATNQSTADDAVATTHAARALAQDRGVAAVAVFTRSGRTARLMANARPRVPILAFTPEAKTRNQLAFAWGTIPLLIPKANSVEEMIDHVRSACRDGDLVQTGEQVVMVASLPVGAMGPPNFVHLLQI
ncbi:MAG: pyruvate kinase [Anaerolineales bacterium]